MYSISNFAFIAYSLSSQGEMRVRIVVFFSCDGIEMANSSCKTLSLALISLSTFLADAFYTRVTRSVQPHSHRTNTMTQTAWKLNCRCFRYLHFRNLLCLFSQQF